MTTTTTPQPTNHPTNTQATKRNAFFDTPMQPPLAGRKVSPPESADGQLVHRNLRGVVRAVDELDALRAGAKLPRVVSDAPASVGGRAEFMEGARLLRMVGPRRKRGMEVRGHQVLLSDVLDLSCTYQGVCEPRRSFKTSTLFAKALGRISAREDYMVAYTMCTKAVKARQRFKDDIVKALELLYPDPKERPFKIVKAGGAERIEWLETGSVFAFMAPKGDSFRSDAWDWIILDEAGEAEPEMGEDLLDGAVATQDTRPEAQFTITGTAPRFRKGNLLWEELEKGRAGLPDHAIVDYSIDQDTQLEDADSWEKVEPFTLACHPNVPDFVPMSRMRSNFDQIKAPSYLREYLGVAGDVTGGGGLLDMEKWNTSGVDGDLPSPPAKFALVMVVHPDGLSAGLVAVWRDDAGVGHVLVLDHRPGSKWVAEEANRLARKYSTEIVHDTVSAVTVEVEWLNRQSPRPKLKPQTWSNVRTAAGLFVKELKAGKIRHYRQDSLTDAAKIVVKRPAGPNSWAFGRRHPDDDIILIEGASMGLRVFDDTPDRPKFKPNF